MNLAINYRLKFHLREDYKNKSNSYQTKIMSLILKLSKLTCKIIEKYNS